MIDISMDGVLARKNGKKDCYYEWTVGCHQVKVGKCSMEVKGLDELFHDYFEKGITAEEIEGSEMIRDVKRQNFIPEDIEDLYEEALIKEYKRYFESRKK